MLALLVMGDLVLGKTAQFSRPGFRLQEGNYGLAPAKRQLTIRLDADVLDWLKGHGEGYQMRINRILRVVMESQPPRRAHR